MLLQRMISENCVNQGTVIVLFGPQSYVKQGPTVYKEESSHSILFMLCALCRALSSICSTTKLQLE